MRSIFVCTLLLAACSQPAAQPSPPVEGFTFRGLKPNATTIADAGATVELCSPDGSCMFKDSMVAGIPAGPTRVIFTDGKFDWFTFEPDPDSFESLQAALTKVYGEPCAVDSVPLQNAMGARFSGDTVVWCFIEGRMTLRRHQRDKVSAGELQFFTDRPAPPPVTYTADTL